MLIDGQDKWDQSVETSLGSASSFMKIQLDLADIGIYKDWRETDTHITLEVPELATYITLSHHHTITPIYNYTYKLISLWFIEAGVVWMVCWFLLSSDFN